MSHADLVSQIFLNSGYICFSLWMSLLLRCKPSLMMINPNVFLSSLLPLFFSSTTSPADSTACYPWVISLCARVPVCHISLPAFSFSPLPLSSPFRTGPHHPSFLCYLSAYFLFTPLLQRTTAFGWPTALKRGVKLIFEAECTTRAALLFHSWL